MQLTTSEPMGQRVSPQPVLEAAWSFAVTRVLATGIELDVFTCIAGGHDTLEDLAKAASCSPRGLSMLLNALIALKYLEVRDGRYGLSPVAAAYLTKTSPHYLGAYVLHNTARSWSTWSELSEAVRKGASVGQSVHGDQPDAEFFSQLAQSLHTLNADAAAVAAEVVTKQPAGPPRRVLDIAAGSAVWSLAVAKQDLQALATVVDLPEVLNQVTRGFVDREGFSDRFTFRPGDLRHMEFGESAFDLVILGHICQFERRFTRTVGVPPKLYARIARFEAALDSKARARERSWTEVAHEFGYHDQMHLVHDFRQFSGETPSHLLTEVEAAHQAQIQALRLGRLPANRADALRLLL